jgi:hypothetical protein
MTKKETIRNLYSVYQEERHLKITEDQFTFFVIFFPALLVIVSDGIVDMDEWEYLQQLAHFMAKSFKEDCEGESDMQSLTKAYLYEISYMIKHIRDWQDEYLEALNEYLTKNPDAKSSVLETMMLFAEASGGTSSEEEEKINNLKTYLNL